MRVAPIRLGRTRGEADAAGALGVVGMVVMALLVVIMVVVTMIIKDRSGGNSGTSFSGCYARTLAVPFEMSISLLRLSRS